MEHTIGENQRLKKRKRWPLIILIILGLIGLAYIFGPKPARPDFSKLQVREFNDDLEYLEDSISKAEAAFQLKPDNEARIIWAQPYKRTPYSMVYLHGNGASQEEGDPVHEALAHRYGCNLYLSRLVDHGLQTEDPMIDIDAEEWMQSALDALVTGHQIGEKVILISCSTGSTLALYLASKFPDLIDGHIMLSPNIDVFDSRSFVLTQPFGLQLARKLNGSKFYGWKAPGHAQKYWYTSYRMEGLCTLKSIINETMTDETFGKVKDPLLMLYYYKNEDHQDKVVSVARMREMYAALGTDPAQKREVALADAGTHIIGAEIFNQHLESVWTPTINFCEEVLSLTPVDSIGWQPFLDRNQQ